MEKKEKKEKKKKNNNNIDTILKYVVWPTLNWNNY